MQRIDQLINTIRVKRRDIGPSRPIVVGISGIDASGKGFITARIADKLKESMNTAVINVDGWLNLPSVRFSMTDPGRHFYEHALRLDEMFEKLILPLKQNAQIDLTADLLEETSTKFHRHRYVYDCLDIILLEGIFLFKRPYIRHFDLRIWIECAFEIGLNRAIERSQECLSPEQTITVYEQVYFPAQNLHFERDHPAESSDIIFENN